MNIKIELKIYFIGGRELSVATDSSIIEKLKIEDWIEIGDRHIRTANITDISVIELEQDNKFKYPSPIIEGGF
ncbi:hypothetical protein [Paenibacillus macquariensis]|uniref:Uncharacterized protein n=1 Tax=Paenibacillus macquariensis TaxID=948756 RepID=A0ABY1JX79_9BACL|nr:hypothetical protein [Paenibacillus macquariensis]MEC0089348.1 hypothetical protein [Paenibacillus macquariensis]OAB33252.1 hypothetical protein PMSM_14655 [Paenibacillus macquariensis subsp. macquariensis]SIQ93286.1 hypothetical protein SAMN05421578_105110 [Paenibacillus macquariensis]